MTRWIMIALLVIGMGMAFLTHSPGVLGLGLVLAVVGAFGTVMSIAAERIAARSRPEAAMLQPDVIAALRERARANGAPAAPPRDRTG
ncbi:MAG: hypothetical protein J0L88_10820 [Xanthomonadales bacterium]|nr:hypothetical protein [Xanthomonadales bacterium]